MSNDKGVIELLNAASILKAKEVDFFIKLVGNGEYINELQNLAINLKISDKVSFEGAVFDKEEIKKYYLEADIYILPTYHEGFPRTIYEAMLFELPIITTFVGGIPGLMKNRYNCLQITPKSPVSIVEAIEFAIEDYGKMREFAANGKLTIQKIFNERKKSQAVDLNAKLSW
jgi:glycosyltransferase involved in cell wall biosynthesis